MQASTSDFGISVPSRLFSIPLKSIHSDEQESLRHLIREARTQAGLTQAELAARLKVPQSFVSKCESGERRLDLLELRLVCEAIGISLSEFVRRLERHIE